MVSRFYLLLFGTYFLLQTNFGWAESDEQSSLNYQVEYFKTIQLSCELPNASSEVIQKVLLWILPNGQVLRPGGETLVDHITLKDNGFVLEVEKVDDELFGLYICMADVGDDVTVIKRGLNLDGPYFGPGYGEQVRHNVMIGGICAGVALVLLISVWVIRVNCCKTSSKGSDKLTVEDTEKGVVIDQSTKVPNNTLNDSIDKVNGIIIDETDNLEKIYDQADGMLFQATKTSSANHEECDKVEINLMDSGEYHTILELNQGSFSENSGSYRHRQGNDTNRKSENNSSEIGNADMTNSGIQSDKRNYDATEADAGLTQNLEGLSDTKAYGLTVTDDLQNTFNDNKSESTDDNEKGPGPVISETTVGDNSEVIYALPQKRHKQEGNGTIDDENKIVGDDSGANCFGTNPTSSPLSTTGLGDFMNNHTEGSNVDGSSPDHQSHSDNKDTVIIVEGEVVIEDSGAKIVVTSSPLTPVISSNTEDVTNKTFETTLTKGQITTQLSEKL